MNALTKITVPFMSLPPARKMTIAGVVLISLLGFGALIFLTGRIDYKPLFSNLSNEDTGEIIKKLKDQKIAYKIATDGKAILVPGDKVHELRISLASEGLPQGGGVGFELFDRKNFGMTEFVQKLNYQRALQGELAKTITQINGVDKARVHLALPEKSVFKDAEKPPTASIVLQMKSGRSLRESEIQGIVHLVASSVEGMNPEQVTLLDNRGKLLSRTGSSDIAGKMSNSMMESQRSYEKSLEDRLQTLLDRAVGPGKSVARVSANLNFKQVEKVEERYDPESTVIRSAQRFEQKDGAITAAAGVPGVQANLAPKPNANSTQSNPASKRDETLNYEVSRSSAKIVEPVGALNKLSVAILVDGKYEPVTNAKSGQQPKNKYAPRSLEELQKIESVVKGAIGFSAERGDQLSVVNIQFQENLDDSPADSQKFWENPVVNELGKSAFLGLAFIALVFFVLRPMMRMVSSEGPGNNDAIPLTSSEKRHSELIENATGGHGVQPSIEMKAPAEILTTVNQDPFQTAQILQNWLRQ